MRRSSAGSLRTAAEQGTARKPRPCWRRRAAENSSPSGFSTSARRKSAKLGVVTPLSSLETSTSSPSRCSTESSEASIWPTAGSAAALGERREEQARGLQRLHQVVAGGGEEAGLAEVGALGLGLGGGERQRALADAGLERLVRLAQRRGGAVALGHVGVDGDEAAARQRVGRDLEHRAVGAAALVDVGPVAALGGAAAGEQGVELALAVLAARLVVADDLLEAGADPHQLGRQVAELEEAPVPERDAELRVEGAEALADVLQRVAHQLVLAEDGAARLVDQLAGVGAREAAVGEQARDHDPRRGRADGAGEQALGRLHRLGVAAAPACGSRRSPSPAPARGRRRRRARGRRSGRRARAGRRARRRAAAARGAAPSAAMPTKRSACRRSAALGSVASETRDVEREVRAEAPEHAVEHAGRARGRRGRRGLSQPTPNGPSASRSGGSQPAVAKAGTATVQTQPRKPAPMPAIAPAAVARRQNRPPISAGANWATAAKEIRPIAASGKAGPMTR